MNTSKYKETGNIIAPIAINMANMSRIEKLRDELTSRWPANLNPIEKERFIGNIDALVFAFEHQRAKMPGSFHYCLQKQGNSALFNPLSLISRYLLQTHKIVLSLESLQIVEECMKELDFEFNTPYSDFVK
jgi:hypothetical protein